MSEQEPERRDCPICGVVPQGRGLAQPRLLSWSVSHWTETLVASVSVQLPLL